MSTAADKPAEPKLITPFWFNQRQLKAEAVGTNLYRVVGPNMPESFIGLRLLENNRYQGFLRAQQDGPDQAVTADDFATAFNAWEGTFELYRACMII